MYSDAASSPMNRSIEPEQAGGHELDLKAP